MQSPPPLGSSQVVNGNALALPLEDASVDLIITSPPYFALRSYQDGGEHYDGQIGSEPTPQDFLEALWAALAECWRVLKPSGSCWVNLGDKYAGSGGNNQSGVGKKAQSAGPSAYNKDSGGTRTKSLMGMPWRFAIGCTDGKAAPDGQQWILRAEVIWNKPNGLPESVRDRVRRSHEQWFHFTKEPRYFTGIDEIRELHAEPGRVGRESSTPHVVGGSGLGVEHGLKWVPSERTQNPLGKLPGSVWTVASEPLKVPEELGIDHFAAFPTEWPRRIIQGFSPTAICVACGEGRSPVVEKTRSDPKANGMRGSMLENNRDVGGLINANAVKFNVTRQVMGYSCACGEPTAATRPAVVLDPFGGTGTVAMVAKALGRTGISVDLSNDYCRLAEWRTNDEKQLSRIRERTYGLPKLRRRKRAVPQQYMLFDEEPL